MSWAVGYGVRTLRMSVHASPLGHGYNSCTLVAGFRRAQSVLLPPATSESRGLPRWQAYERRRSCLCSLEAPVHARTIFSGNRSHHGIRDQASSSLVRQPRAISSRNRPVKSAFALPSAPAKAASSNGVAWNGGVPDDRIAGLGAGLAVTRYVSNLPYRVVPDDPPDVMAACEIMLWVSASVMIATFVPAWRVDPMVVLRSMIDRGNRLASPHPSRHYIGVEQNDDSDHTRKQQAMLHRESEQP